MCQLCLVLLLDTTGKYGFFSWMHSPKYLYTWRRSPWAFFSPGWVLTALCLFPCDRCSSHFIIFMVPQETHSSISMCLSYKATWHWTQHSNVSYLSWVQKDCLLSSACNCLTNAAGCCWPPLLQEYIAMASFLSSMTTSSFLQSCTPADGPSACIDMWDYSFSASGCVTVFFWISWGRCSPCFSSLARSFWMAVQTAAIITRSSQFGTFCIRLSALSSIISDFISGIAVLILTKASCNEYFSFYLNTWACVFTHGYYSFSCLITQRH